jgi:cytochrome c oxidase subunit 2
MKLPWWALVFGGKSMKRRTHARSGPTDRKTARQGFAKRLFTLGTLATVAVILLTACGASPEDEKPYSTTSPASPTADDIQDLYKLVFWLALVVFVGVQFAIVYTALRFRRSRTITGPRPPQIHGNKRLEIIWTIIPAVVLLVVLIPTITTMYDNDAAAEEGDLIIDVYGKQWWWEIHYGVDNGQGGEELGVITANELYLPEGKEAIIRMHSNNVIHSFWVPQLSGKMDVVPGHENKLSITPTESGEYFGECAEFCGAQHAWMRFKVIVQPENQFYDWVNAWRVGNPGNLNPEDADAAGVTKVPAAFAVCLSCHSVNGVGGVTGGLEAPAQFGPDLTNLACRETIAAGLLQNNPENLATWVNDPSAVKSGNYMSTQITAGLIRDNFGEQGFNDLMGYLATLQPAGGCESIGAVNYLGADNVLEPAASPEASPVASPEASPVATPAS